MLIKQAAKSHGRRFESSFSDKILLRCIRNYYGKQAATSKNRLITMVANPTRLSNIKLLGEFFEFLEQIQKKNDAGEQKEEMYPASSPAPKESVAKTPKPAPSSVRPSLTFTKTLWVFSCMFVNPLDRSGLPISALRGKRFINSHMTSRCKGVSQSVILCPVLTCTFAPHSNNSNSNSKDTPVVPCRHTRIQISTSTEQTLFNSI